MPETKIDDITEKNWQAERPDDLSDLDKDLSKALGQLEKFTSKGVDDIVAAGEVDGAVKACTKLVKTLADAEKHAKKLSDKKQRKQAEALLDTWTDVIESFKDEVESAVEDSGYEPEVLAMQSSYNADLLKFIKKTSSGPKPYALAFRDYGAKKDVFAFVVFWTGRVKPTVVTKLEKDMKRAVGPSFDRVDGVVRKDGTKYIFEYPSGVNLPEKLVRQMKLELGLKAEFTSVSQLAEVVVDDGPESGGEAAGSDADEGVRTAAREA